jgi:DNA-binding PadR family transcriptional regulator
LREASALRLIWTVKQGQLYALLGRLEEEGYLNGSLEPQDSRPPRKMLSLTDAGEAFYKRWMIEPVHRPRQFRQELLAKLFCARQAGPDTLHLLLDRQRVASRVLLEELQAQVSAAHERPYEALVYRLRALQTEAHLAWLDECEQSLIESASAAPEAQ